MPSSPMDSGVAAAIVAASGKQRCRPGQGVSTGAPKRSMSRRVSVRAAATVTCWPRTMRAAVSKPSKLPGMRRPAAIADAG